MGVGHPLTQDQIEIIRRNYPNMCNNEIAALAGCSLSSVCVVQHMFGLRKSKEHRRKMLSKAGKASNISRGGKALNITQEVKEKRKATWRQTFREERARVVFGLPQKTRMRVKQQPKAKCSQRSYLKKLGYILDEPNCVAYYTPETTRATKMERGWCKRIRNYYKFRPLETHEEEHQREQNPLAVAGE